MSKKAILARLNVHDPATFLLIAGPCVVEDEATTYTTAEALTAICNDLRIPLVFKASYRKANRSKLSSFTGIGDRAALDILASIRSAFDVPVTTDIHSEQEAALAAEYVDVLQIPAFLCRQTDLLTAAAQTGKVINIKKGQFAGPAAMQHAVEKVFACGNDNVLLTERGTTFGYQDLVVDFRNIPAMQAFGVPVVLDCTHSLQQPNLSEGVTGGLPQYIHTLAAAGIAAGADGIFIETHPHPAQALSDGANMLPLDELRPLLEKLQRIRKAITS